MDTNRCMHELPAGTCANCSPPSPGRTAVKERGRRFLPQKTIRIFNAQFAGRCRLCNARVEEGDEAGFYDEEFCCELCCAESGLTLTYS